MNEMNIVLVGLYRYVNFNIRIMHPLLKNIYGVKPHIIFFKNCQMNEFNPPTDREERLFVKLIKELNPKLVGFSVLSPYTLIARRLTKLIKKNNPSCLVIWGGVHPTIAPEDCINDVDVLCIGEGEEAITELARNLKDNKPYQLIKNLWVKNGDSVIKNSMRQLVQNLDLLPFPSYGEDSFYFIDSNKITKKDPLLLDNCYWSQTSRGCPYSCSYCVNSLLRPLFKDLGHYTRRRSVDNIIKELKAYLSLPGSRAEYIFFIDEIFGTNESWLDEFGLRYKKEIGLPFHIDYIPEIMNLSKFRKLVSAGLDTVNFGIQSTSDFVRNQIFQRPGKRDKILDLAREVTAYNVRINFDLIMNNPYETEQSLKDGIEFLLCFPKPVFFNLYSLQYFPYYPFTEKAIEDKHIQSEDANIDSLFKKTAHLVFIPQLLPYTKKQILQNVIWLIAYNRVKGDIVKYSVFGDSIGSKLCLIYLNFKAIFLGKILGYNKGIIRHAWFSRFINGFKYALKGDLKTLYIKLREHI